MFDDIEDAVKDYITQLHYEYGMECYEMVLQALVGRMVVDLADAKVEFDDDPSNDNALIVRELEKALELLKSAYKNINL